MYKVFVVDDEIVIREGLRNNIRWEENGFSLVGEAPDGEIALPMIRDEKPDILITDIRMPFMDGIELCREVRKFMPWIQVIILSGFDSFEYAKQSISLGVQEYLLKPISSEELQLVLGRIAGRIESERRQRNDLDRLRQQMVKGKALVRDQIISNSILNGLTEAEAKKVCTDMRSFGLNLLSPCYVVLEFRSTSSSHDYSDMHASLMPLAECFCDSVFLSNTDTVMTALILGDNEKDIEERAYSFAQTALDELDRAGFEGMRVSIGETVFHFWDVFSSYKTARHARHLAEKSHQPLQMQRIIGTRDVREASKDPSLAKDIKPLYDCLKYAEEANYRDLFLAYVDSLRQVNGYIPVGKGFVQAEVLLTAVRIIQESGGDPQNILEEQWLEAGSLPSDDLEEYIPDALDILDRVIRFRESKGNLKGNPAVNKARKYLEDHYSNPNLTFQDVVSHVNMSSSHFSTLFSQSQGITFTKYLINLRLEKAKELLQNTSLRSSEIAYAVGYNDPHYFSYLFKKETGITPSEFRSEQHPV